MTRPADPPGECPLCLADRRAAPHELVLLTKGTSSQALLEPLLSESPGRNWTQGLGQKRRQRALSSATIESFRIFYGCARIVKAPGGTALRSVPYNLRWLLRPRRVFPGALAVPDGD